MAEKSTFIKLDRNILNWRWYQDANTFRVFIHVLINANISTHGFMGVDIQRGEMASSYDNIAKSLNLTKMEVRTAINHLKLTGELTLTRHSKFSVFSVVNYDLYQGNLTHNVTFTQHSLNTHSTFTQHQLKNIKNIRSKEGKKETARPCGTAVSREVNSAGLPVVDFGIKHRDF